MASAGDEEKRFEFYVFIYLAFLQIDHMFLGRLGNEAFVEKKFDEAMTHYNAAINIDPENAVYYSNRRFVGYLRYVNLFNFIWPMTVLVTELN